MRGIFFFFYTESVRWGTLLRGLWLLCWLRFLLRHGRRFGSLSLCCRPENKQWSWFCPKIHPKYCMFFLQILKNKLYTKLIIFSTKIANFCVVFFKNLDSLGVWILFLARLLSGFTCEALDLQRFCSRKQRRQLFMLNTHFAAVHKFYNGSEGPVRNISGHYDDWMLAWIVTQQLLQIRTARWQHHLQIKNHSVNN